MEMLSFQPLLSTDALQQTTLETLAPWTFSSLRSSIEAATTFCVASKGSSGKAGAEASEGNEEMPMSLRRFGMEDSGDSSRWQHAFTTFTKELGTALTLPGVLRDADLAFLELTKTGVHHSRAGRAGQGLGGSAVVVCVVEGVLSFSLTPLPPSLAALQCVAGQCQVTVKAEQRQDIAPDLYLLTQTTTHPRACLYAPPGWQWSAAALHDSTFLVFTWEEDLVIREDVVADLFPEEGNEGSEGTRRERRAGDTHAVGGAAEGSLAALPVAVGGPEPAAPPAAALPPLRPPPTTSSPFLRSSAWTVCCCLI
ncbi:uncharacterized protein LOC135111437 isoform X2 [Scylla paramamosain]|uniref:uncharacterized protein LOC135111437 isoform X2 n=1 Tax=Scylla paramamosain TaxID=85552 RepID=UPI0030837EFD